MSASASCESGQFLAADPRFRMVGAEGGSEYGQRATVQLACFWHPPVSSTQDGEVGLDSELKVNTTERVED